MLKRRKLDIVNHTQTQQIDEVQWKAYFEQLYADASGVRDKSGKDKEK